MAVVGSDRPGHDVLVGTARQQTNPSQTHDIQTKQHNGYGRRTPDRVCQEARFPLRLGTFGLQKYHKKGGRLGENSCSIERE